jgi:site-specific DNA-cytosine methylase
VLVFGTVKVEKLGIALISEVLPHGMSHIIIKNGGKTPKYASQTQFWKPFPGYDELFQATIDGFDSASGYYHVTYDDGDEEDLTERQVTHWIKMDLKPDQLDINKDNAAPPKSPKYVIGTKFTKSFSGQPFEGVIESYGDGLYHVRYPADGDEEDLTERELTRCLDASPPAKPKPVVTVSSSKGRSISKISYCDHEDDSQDDSDKEDAPPKKRRVSGARKRDNDSDEEAPLKKRRASTGNRGSSAKKRRSKNDHDDDASDSHHDMLALTWEDLLPDTDPPPKAPARNGPVVKYTPVYPDLSLGEIKATKEYLDPRATGDIMDRLVGEQVNKVGGLLQRALRDMQTLGSVGNPLTLGTAGTGTDAPALALSMVQEQIKKRLATSSLRQDNKGDTAKRKEDKGNSNDPLPLLNYSHKFSCENESYKQAYISRNFDSVVYPEIAKLCEHAPLDVFGQIQPLPKVNTMVVGTSCQNFGSASKDLDTAGSGDTFVDAVQVILQEQPQACILDNIREAPWQKMADYICGRIKLSDCDSKKALGNEDSNLLFSFSLSGSKIVVEAVPSFLSVQCGATVAGYLKGIQGMIHPVEWPNNKPKTENCTLMELLKANNKIDKKYDTLVLDRPVTYCCHWIHVDAKDYGLPQTRQRTYMFVWQPLPKPPDGHFYPDDLGVYWEALMQYLESNVKHSLEAFTLPVDHDQVRTFREALREQPSPNSYSADSSIPGLSSATTSVENSSRQKGIEDEKGVGMNGGAPGKKKVPPHYWLEYLKSKSELSAVRQFYSSSD